jgi:hypothetical protein
MLQNLPSIVAALVLAPLPGSRVLDMCAAPGGKTTLIAQLMGDSGEVVALDRSHAKVRGRGVGMGLGGGAGLRSWLGCVRAPGAADAGEGRQE